MSHEEFNRPPVAEVPFSASLSLHLHSSRQEVVPLSPRRASRIYPAWLRTPHRLPNNARFVSVRSAFYPGRVFFESVLPACRFPFFFFFLLGAWWPSPPPLPPFFFTPRCHRRHFTVRCPFFHPIQVAQQVETLQLYFPFYCGCCCLIYQNVDIKNIIWVVERSLRQYSLLLSIWILIIGNFKFVGSFKDILDIFKGI